MLFLLRVLLNASMSLWGNSYGLCFFCRYSQNIELSPDEAIGIEDLAFVTSGFVEVSDRILEAFVELYLGPRN